VTVSNVCEDERIVITYSGLVLATTLGLVTSLKVNIDRGFLLALTGLLDDGQRGSVADRCMHIGNSVCE
jgi:hypothetical protein